MVQGKGEEDCNETAIPCSNSIGSLCCKERRAKDKKEANERLNGSDGDLLLIESIDLFVFGTSICSNAHKTSDHGVWFLCLSVLYPILYYGRGLD